MLKVLGIFFLFLLTYWVLGLIPFFKESFLAFNYAIFGALVITSALVIKIGGK